MKLFELDEMASTAMTIKQEIVDSAYKDDDDCSHSYISENAKADSRKSNSTDCSDEGASVQPLPKRRRLTKESPPLLNGHGGHDTEDILGLNLGPPYEHHDHEHPSDLLNQLNRRRQEEQFVDVTLVVDGKEIPCHKVILCSVSDYFAELLVPNSATRYQQRLYVNETSCDIMIQLIEYAYTSKIKISEHNIEQLLVAAKILKFNSVFKACINLLKYRLAADNCIRLWRFVEQQCTSPELVEWVVAFIQHHFDRIASSKDFYTLSVDELLLLISSKNINVKQEEVIYESVMEWIRHDLETRKKFLPKFLEHICLPLVKPQFLLDVVEQEPLIKNNKDCEKYLNEAKRYQLLPEQRPLMQSCRTRPRLSYSSKKTEVLVTVGGLNKEKSPLQDCTYIDFPNPFPQHISPLQITQSAYSVAVVNNNIFVTGGANKKPLADVWMYIPSLDKWKQVFKLNNTTSNLPIWASCWCGRQTIHGGVVDRREAYNIWYICRRLKWVAPLQKARYLHASVGLAGFLYVIGGHDGKERLRSIEKFNPDTNSWQYFHSMLKPLSSPTAVACDGHLYVLGGATGSSSKDIVADVQWYNPEAEAWQQVAPLPQPERGAVAANLDGTIYVMGKGKSVISYNRKSNKWVKRNNTVGGHLHGAATVHRNQLYVAGGLHGNVYLNGTVELYDRDNDVWQVNATLHTPVYAQGFVSIFKDSTPFSGSI